ncbi:MAG: cell division protein FtsQ/DivIB [Pseudomonadota bacterium]
MRSIGRRARRPEAAPSRWAWRLERLMLTPVFVLFLRTGVPLVLAFLAGTWWFSDETRRIALIETLRETRASIETRPEFLVQLMAIEGADYTLAADIRAEIPLEFPLSSFDLDLEAIRDRIIALPPVETATVRIRPGGVMQVDVVPRLPVAVWRNRKGLSLLDSNGIEIGAVQHRLEHPDLPLIVGFGADAMVEEALQLYSAATPLGPRLRGVARIGERRWDVVLDRGQRILLPETAPVEALERVIALDSAQDIFARDIHRVDLRLGTRPTVKMSEYATDLWWDIKEASGQ